MERFLGRPVRPAPQRDDDEDVEETSFCCDMRNENSMMDWDWKASPQYGGQSADFADWLSRLSRDPNQPKITTWISGSQHLRQVHGSDGICRACDNFDVKTAVHKTQTAYSERYAFYNKRTLVKELKTAAQDLKCQRCAVVLQALHYLGLQEEQANSLDEVELRIKFLPSSVAVFTEEPPRYLEIFPSEGEPSGVLGFPPSNRDGRKRNADVSSLEFYEELTMAINDCILNHRPCRPSPGPAVRPNRLVVVPADSDESVKIIKAPPDVEFAALSHCWGKEPLKRLLKVDGDGDVTFNLKELPPSFVDACTVARGLFLQYIWIDSLCIVQDDADDWAREAAKMGAIYEAAYVTISATDAAASTHGFLFPRFTEDSFTALDDDENRLVRFTTRKYNLERYNEKFPHYGDTPEHPWLMIANEMDTKYLNPLQLRGWCFQERILSKRVLHFKRYEVVLECNAGFRCECSGMRKLSSKSIKALSNLMMQDPLSHAEILRTERLREMMWKEMGRGAQAALTLQHVSANGDARMMQTWEMLVVLYTRTIFTHQDDVLEALGSLAKVFQSLKPSWRYGAGIWLSNFPRSLMWLPYASRTGDGKKASRTKPRDQNTPKLGAIAPSFSWASLSGRIRFLAAGDIGQREAEFISSEFTPVTGADSYGDIASGHILLRGRMIAFRFYKSKKDNTEDHHDGVEVHVDDGWDCSRSEQEVEMCTDPSAEPREWKPTSKVETGMETMERVKGFDCSDEYSDYFDDGPRTSCRRIDNDGLERIKEPLYAFRLTSGARHGLRGSAAVVLLLRKVAGANKEVYKRVGLRMLKDQAFVGSPDVQVRIE